MINNKDNKEVSKDLNENKSNWNIINVLPPDKLNERQSKYISNELYKIFSKYCTA